MRIGDIYQNLMAGYESYFVYTGKTVRTFGKQASSTQGYAITKISGRWELSVATYDRDALLDHERFPRVGHIDLERQRDAFIGSILGSVKK